MLVARIIGLIGFGQFGQFAAKLLKDRFKVLVTDKRDLQPVANEIGVDFVSLEQAASSKIVIVATPISNLEETLKEIKPFLPEGCLVIDVCSVKEKPVKLMQKILPETVQILGTHPLFGPQSGKSGLQGLKIVLCPVRISPKQLDLVEDFLEELGLEVFVMTAKEHDQQMAGTQALTHFLAKSLLNLGWGKEVVTTKSFDLLFEMVELVKNDSPQLFRDMQTENQFATEIRKNLIQEMIKINEKLRRKK